MAQKLTGKVAVVTGAGSEAGIGKEVAKAMAAEGAKVVVNDIVKDKDGMMGADRVVKQIRDAGGTAVANYDRVGTVSNGEKIIRTAIDSFGRIDILVNTAGNLINKPAVEMTEEEWDSILTVHLKGHFSCSRAAAREMIKQGSGGRIVNISSRGAFMYGNGTSPPPPDRSSVAYSAAKAGILGLTVCLAAEFTGKDITVNAIVPSASTHMFPGHGPRWFGGGVREDPEFVAPIIVYLATDQAKNINGQFFYACGGDICIFSRPLQLPGPHMFIRKAGKWTLDELNEAIPPMIGQG
jgi:NAD(P)-dependent dehydrogenase (short-subunit alcohol dehydrogenase family)